MRCSSLASRVKGQAKTVRRRSGTERRVVFYERDFWGKIHQHQKSMAGDEGGSEDDDETQL